MADIGILRHPSSPNHTDVAIGTSDLSQSSTMAEQPAPTKYFTKDISLALTKSTFPAKLAYFTLGSPSDPAILLPTCYGGKLATTLPFLFLGPSAPLPPSKYFIIVLGLLGGGESSSPSNTPAPHSGKNFPQLTYEDNVRLQHALCTEELGLKKLFAYIGFSMGGQQAYHFGTLFPSFVENIVCICGSARTSWHNWSFLEGPKAALVNSVDFKDGEYTEPVKRGTSAFGRVYSTWALSQEWFRQKCWEKVGCKDLQEYLARDWDGDWEDAHDLLCLLHTWQKGDITVYYPEDEGDLSKTLGRIEARTMVMPSRTDAYFPPEDNEEEVKHLRDGKFVVIPSIWGHLAGGGGGTEEDGTFVAQQIKEFLGA